MVWGRCGMNADRLAEEIWDKVFDWKYQAKTEEYKPQADVASKVIRHMLIEQIAKVISSHIAERSDAGCDGTSTGVKS